MGLICATREGGKMDTIHWCENRIVGSVGTQSPLPDNAFGGRNSRKQVHLHCLIGGAMRFATASDAFHYLADQSMARGHQFETVRCTGAPRPDRPLH